MRCGSRGGSIRGAELDPARRRRAGSARQGPRERLGGLPGGGPARDRRRRGLRGREPLPLRVPVGRSRRPPRGGARRRGGRRVRQAADRGVAAGDRAPRPPRRRRRQAARHPRLRHPPDRARLRRGVAEGPGPAVRRAAPPAGSGRAGAPGRRGAQGGERRPRALVPRAPHPPHLPRRARRAAGGRGDVGARSGAAGRAAAGGRPGAGRATHGEPVEGAAAVGGGHAGPGRARDRPHPPDPSAGRVGGAPRARRPALRRRRARRAPSAGLAAGAAAPRHRQGPGLRSTAAALMGRGR